MFKLIETTQTIYSQSELCRAVIEAWNNLYQSIPSKAAVGIILSQHSIETGAKYFWNNNWGNLKVGNDDPNQTVDYMMLKNVWEIENGVKKIYQPPARQTWFRSFPTLIDGVTFHLNLLKNGRYKSSWPAIEAGDVALFAHDLKVNGYYTAPESDYVAGMNRFFHPYMASQDYDQALSESGLVVAPPLQPWVSTPDDPTPPGISPLDPPAQINSNIPPTANWLSTIFTSIMEIFRRWLPKS